MNLKKVQAIDRRWEKLKLKHSDNPKHLQKLYEKGIYHEHIMRHSIWLSINSSANDRKKYNTGDYWLNRVQCNKCMDVITSVHLHDFKSCGCSNLSVDGGSWNPRRIFAIPEYLDLSVTFKD